MNYCSHCGKPVTHRIPEGDNRHRYVCDHCDRIHYENPRIVAGTVPIWNGQVLLCRRAIEPRKGYWTLPAGFMENSETTVEAAVRETQEEALAAVNVDGLYTILHVPHIDQVHMFFRASLTDGSFGAGEESLDAQLFPLADIPWEELAFPTIRETLEYFVEDIERDDFPLHIGDIRRRLGQ
ncbi:MULTISPECIES: NUDIX hydrolase [Marinobacter]|uniref:NUDIX hydrolase n=1 Tax=Marinobacter TaxID=2742 RepID=UPI000DAED0B4|nr:MULTISPECIES: NUDIX hydrolase [Marinobacter]